jgi:CRISPR/Cas system CMR subunit Cmr4 (Cas7 group RAMP superfamily)
MRKNRLDKAEKTTSAALRPLALEIRGRVKRKAPVSVELAGAIWNQEKSVIH